MTARYLSRLIAGEQLLGEPGSESPSVEHYWRWPVMLRLRPIRRYGIWFIQRVSLHGIRDGVVRGLGPFHPAVRSMLWVGPVGLEFGWRRQAIENWRWRRRLRRSEQSATAEEARRGS